MLFVLDHYYLHLCSLLLGLQYLFCYLLFSNQFHLNLLILTITKLVQIQYKQKDHQLTRSQYKNLCVDNRLHCESSRIYIHHHLHQKHYYHLLLLLLQILQILEHYRKIMEIQIQLKTKTLERLFLIKLTIQKVFIMKIIKRN